MSYNYTQFVNSLATLLVIPVNNADYQTILPNIIDDGEQRCYRDLDLLSTIIRDQSGTLTANSRNFTFPQHIVVLESLNVFSPVSTTFNRQPLVPTTREWIDWVWPNEAAPSAPSIPNKYAMITDQSIIVGPPPDTTYTMEVVGTIRPTPLSASNTTTYLSLYLPDLFLTACLIFGYGYLKDYGATTDDPNAPASWEAHYNKELQSANIEENRKKYASQAWTPKQPAPLATPPRA